MSLNYRRDSFSDRFCDDFSGDVLQFLPLKDKFRLECVSKQFQRTVFVKQTELEDKYDFKSEDQLKDFERLLQKLPNIKVCPQLSGTYREQALDLIIKYCHKITHLSTFDSVQLMDKFCPQLKSLKLSPSRYLDSLQYKWQTMTNIEELVFYRLTPQMSYIRFKRLKRFAITDDLSFEDLELLEAFVGLNASTITHFEISWNQWNRIKDNSLKTCLDRILKISAKIPNLVHFRLDSGFPLNDKQFATNLRQIALNCVHLKSLDIDLQFGDSFDETDDQFLSPLRQFKRLKRLSLRILDDYEDFFTFKAFKGFEGITHLEIVFDESLGDRELTDIDIYFPKLQSLKIFGTIDGNEETIDILSGLSRLQTIVLKGVIDKSIILLIKERLLRDCTKIKNILIKNVHD